MTFGGEAQAAVTVAQFLPKEANISNEEDGGADEEANVRADVTTR